MNGMLAESYFWGMDEETWKTLAWIAGILLVCYIVGRYSNESIVGASDGFVSRV